MLDTKTTKREFDVFGSVIRETVTVSRNGLKMSETVVETIASPVVETTRDKQVSKSKALWAARTPAQKKRHSEAMSQAMREYWAKKKADK